MVAQSKIEAFITEWEKASKPELRARLKSLKTKSKTSSVIAEIKAIQALLA